MSSIGSADSAAVVLVLPVLQPAGAERIVAELAKRLPEHGFATSVICLEDERTVLGEELARAGVPVTGLRMSRFRTRACSKALVACLPPTRPLILHAHLYHANLAARLAAARLMPAGGERLHVVSTVHVAEKRFRPWQFLLDRMTARHTRVEVCVSRAAAEFHRRKTGLPAEFFRVIENGIDLQRYSPADRSGRSVTTGGQPRVVSVGRLDPQKDIPTLLRAWQIVQARLVGATLSIAGSGPERGKLLRLRRRLDLRRVELLDFVRDIPGLLRNSDIYVQSSAWEGFGLAVVEAMASKLPVIVTAVDSLPELVTHEKTGLIVPPFDPPAMAESILRLAADPQMATALATAARAEAQRRFSVDRMVADYAQLYRELLAATPSAR